MCGTLCAFLQNGLPQYYKGTMIDYILDQLFIHLDDADVKVQNAVLEVIVVASGIDKALVLRKAESGRHSHRSPAMCDAVPFRVSGIEILED
jgi:hypothetical protein